MGAAGAVKIYKESQVRAAYEMLWGEFGYTIEKDWWYPSWPDGKPNGHRGNTVRVELGGEWYLVDYADDQGNQEGTNNSFWFTAPNYIDDPSGATLPNGNRKRIRDPQQMAKEWGEIDAKVSPDSEHYPWIIHPKNRDSSAWAAWDLKPAQARVLLALRECPSVWTEVWT